GAGGNAGAVAGMLLFKKQLTGLEWTDSFFVLGFIVLGVSFSSFLVRFSKRAQVIAKKEAQQTHEEKEIRLQPELAKAAS
ncbi:MAG: MFS transporter, partial [Marinoscillum sp.]